MGAIELLTEDHEKVKGLFEELLSTTNRAEKKRMELLEKIRSELLAHTKIEEEIFYPAFKQADGQEHKKLFFEAMEEHRAVEKLVLPDLADTDVTSEQFPARAKVLKELILHHVEEEEQELFPQARKSMNSELLVELGERMAARRKELMKQL